MKLQDKVRLMQLLQMYQTEKAEENIKGEKDEHGYLKKPSKSLYIHARVIANRLALEIEHELKSIWEA